MWLFGTLQWLWTSCPQAPSPLTSHPTDPKLHRLVCLYTPPHTRRVFDMEVIGGKEAFETEVVQHGYRFKLDFSKVGLGGG